MESAVFDVLDVADETGGALPLQTAALSLATKISQALEAEAEEFVDKVIDFVTAKIKLYHTKLTSGTALTPAAAETWKAFFHQAGEYIVTLVSISPDTIAAHCVKFFPTICALLSISPLKAQLMDMLGHTSMLAIKAAVDEAGEDDDDDDDDDDEEDDDEDDEKQATDFLEQKLVIAQLNAEGGDEPPFVITPAELPFASLKSVTAECIKLFEEWFATGSEDFESASAILGVTTALSAQRFSKEEHVEIFGVALPPLLAKMKQTTGNVEWTRMKEVVTSVRDILRHAHPEAFRPFYAETFETLRKLQLAIKDWVKAHGAKKNKKTYNSFRTAMLRCVGAVIAKDPQSIVPFAGTFMTEVAPVFADPMVLAHFVSSLAAVADNAQIQADLKDKYLPEVMKQFLGELRKDTISKYVRELIIDSVSRVGLKVGALFEPYFEETHKLLIKSIEIEDNEYAEKSINGIAMLFEGCRTKPEALKKAIPATLEELEKILKLEFDLSKMLAGEEDDEDDDDDDDDAPAGKFGFGAKKAGGAAAGGKGGFGKIAHADEEDEEDDEFDDDMGGVDVVVRLQHKALLALQFFCQEQPLVEAFVAGAAANKLEELFNMLLGKLVAVSYFEDDFILKIPQVSILSTLFQKVPSLRNAENKEKLAKAFASLELDFEELQEAQDMLGKLTL